MAQDTPEGHASVVRDEILIREALLKALQDEKVQIIDLGPIDGADHTGHGCDEDQTLNREDVAAIDAVSALAMAIQANSQLSNHLVTNTLTRSNLVYRDLAMNWLEIHDRLLAREANELLENWGSTPFAAPGETYGEGTLEKVRRALTKLGFSTQTTTDAITEMQNEGILFRERTTDTTRLRNAFDSAMKDALAKRAETGTVPDDGSGFKDIHPRESAAAEAERQAAGNFTGVDFTGVDFPTQTTVEEFDRTE